MNHLALATHDLAATSAFYRRYFGFVEGPGPWMLRGKDGFVLTIDEVPEPVVVPSWFHHGFVLADRAEVDALHARLVEDGVLIVDPPKLQGATVCFFCKDPAGLLVEVRAPAT